MVGRTYQVKRRQIKKEGKKRKKKERKKTNEKRKKERKKGEVNKTKGKNGRRKGGMKNRKEKERKKSWDQVLNKRKDCVGSEPSALVYIGILVTSTTTGHDGSVVSALASQAKGRGSIPSCGTSFFSHKYFFRTSVKKVIEQTIHQFGWILSGDAIPT